MLVTTFTLLYPDNIYLLKVNNTNTRGCCKICSKLKNILYRPTRCVDNKAEDGVVIRGAWRVIAARDGCTGCFKTVSNVRGSRSAVCNSASLQSCYQMI